MGEKLGARLIATGEEVATTIVAVEEQLRGWLAQIHRMNEDPEGQVPVYRRLQGRIEFFSHWKVLSWTQAAAELFVPLRKRGVRIGSMDLKIACIAISHRATLLTRNRQDFERVPDLKFANWLE